MTATVPRKRGGDGKTAPQEENLPSLLEDKNASEEQKEEKDSTPAASKEEMDKMTGEEFTKNMEKIRLEFVETHDKVAISKLLAQENNSDVRAVLVSGVTLPVIYSHFSPQDALAF